MKKALKLFLISALVLSTCGCNKYIKSTHEGDLYYGAYNRRDFIHADVTIYKKDSDKVCNGVVFLNAPTRSFTMKNDRVDAKMKLGCNDGSIMDMKWKLRKGSFTDGYGEGTDQFNNKYTFKTISKVEFKKIADIKRVKYPNSKNPSYLKY